MSGLSIKGPDRIKNIQFRNDLVLSDKVNL